MEHINFDWRKFLKSQRAYGTATWIQEYFKRRGISEPTLEQIEKIPHDDLLEGWGSMMMVKEIKLLQQKIRELC